jgi:hypothetical protein
MEFLWKLYLKLEGWKAANEFPNHLKKAVAIIGPHTYWKDFTIGLAARSVLKIKYGKYLEKPSYSEVHLDSYFVGSAVHQLIVSVSGVLLNR